MGIKLSDFIKDPHNVFTQEEAEMIYLAAGLEEENKRLREALEEIARGRVPGASYKARQALEGEE